MINEVTCFYYGENCLDGLVSAWIVKQNYPEAKLIPVNYQQRPEEYPSGKVFVVDFTFPRKEDMVGLIENADVVYHYDHHRSAQKVYEELAQTYGDNDRYRPMFRLDLSAAMITFDQLALPEETRIPEKEIIHGFPRESFTRTYERHLISYVEDRDLWIWRYWPQSKYFTVALRERIGRENSQSAMLRIIDQMTQTHFEETIAIGRRLYQEQVRRARHYIRTTLSELELYNPEDLEILEVPCVEATSKKDVSETAHQMLKDEFSDVVAVIYSEDNETLRVRISASDRKPQADRIAQFYGGGGHPKAAGITTKNGDPLYAHITRKMENYCHRVGPKYREQLNRHCGQEGL